MTEAVLSSRKQRQSIHLLDGRNSHHEAGCDFVAEEVGGLWLSGLTILGRQRHRLQQHGVAGVLEGGQIL